MFSMNVKHNNKVVIYILQVSTKYIIIIIVIIIKSIIADQYVSRLPTSL